MKFNNVHILLQKLYYQEREHCHSLYGNSHKILSMIKNFRILSIQWSLQYQLQYQRMKPLQCLLLHLHLPPLTTGPQSHQILWSLDPPLLPALLLIHLITLQQILIMMIILDPVKEILFILYLVQLKMLTLI